MFNIRRTYMNINYELYKIFFQVAKNKSISKAAEVMFISQPAVSQSIRQLEDKLGGKLFIRTKKGVILTEEGNILYKYISSGIQSFINGENSFLNYMNLDSGSIRMGASTTVMRHIVMPYIEKFHSQYPGIDVKIVNHLTKDLLSYLRNGDLDLLVVNLPMKYSKDLTVIPICEVEDILVGNSHYYEKTNGKIQISDISKYPFVVQQNPSNTRKFLDNYLKENGVTKQFENEIVSYGLVMDFVKAGFGIGFATKQFILEELKQKQLFEITIEPKIPKREIGIVVLNTNIPNYSSKKLIELITSNDLQIK